MNKDTEGLEQTNGTPDLFPTDRQRVLVADDEAGIRDLFRMVLDCELKDCRVDLAVNGAEVVEAFRQAHHGVILLDVHMPVMDGIQAFEEIHSMCREEGWELPAFVFCTGFEASTALQNIVSSNPRHCLLQKPVANNILVEALRVRLDL